MNFLCRSPLSTSSTSFLITQITNGESYISNQMKVDTMSFQWMVSFQMRTNPPRFHSASNLLSMQAEDCAWLCTQVIEANRRNLPSVSLSAHLFGFYPPHRASRQCPTNRGGIEPSLSALILSTSSVIPAWIILQEEGELTPDTAQELLSETALWVLRLNRAGLCQAGFELKKWGESLKKSDKVISHNFKFYRNPEWVFVYVAQVTTLLFLWFEGKSDDQFVFTSRNHYCCITDLQPYRAPDIKSVRWHPPVKSLQHSGLRPADSVSEHKFIKVTTLHIHLCEPIICVWVWKDLSVMLLHHAVVHKSLLHARFWDKQWNI